MNNACGLAAPAGDSHSYDTVGNSFRVACTILAPLCRLVPTVTLT